MELKKLNEFVVKNTYTSNVMVKDFQAMTIEPDELKTLVCKELVEVIAGAIIEKSTITESRRRDEVEYSASLYVFTNNELITLIDLARKS